LKLIELLEFTATTRGCVGKHEDQSVVLNTTNAAPHWRCSTAMRCRATDFTLSRGATGFAPRKRWRTPHAGEGFQLTRTFSSQPPSDSRTTRSTRCPCRRRNGSRARQHRWAPLMMVQRSGDVVYGSKTIDLGASTYFSTRGFMCTRKPRS